MGFALHLLLTATPPPGGDLREGLNADQVSPGLTGFIATFAVVAVTILLILDMTRRIRRVRYRNDQEPVGGSPVGYGDAETGGTAVPAERNQLDDEGGAPPHRDSPDPGPDTKV
ncbi:hypothetical protein [Arthrobacter roseus]|uniref:hypothetical protein n=1 Tax=Arthrobacter roseus TaxID=136274 RepID=UPI001964BDF4|nr:hypothetical protein [Arthrobacter roseus]MBM7847979.1 hypothetical protein [Arthrobacter roseus]